MITKDEYLAALELVDRYHRQFNKVDAISNNKTLVDDWIIENDDRISGRLIRCLEATTWNNREYARAFKYMEDINRRSFYAPRNNGAKSWDELKRVLNDIKNHEKIHR
jgi:hypothetical protein